MTIEQELSLKAWTDLSRESRREVLAEAREVARQVGGLLRAYLTSPDLISRRAEADLRAEKMIRAHLSERFPHWGFRAEEEPELNQTVELTRPFWLVDPNDGTSAFLKGERGASVSIALISEGVPVLGVIFAYGAPHHGGDLFTWAEGGEALSRNGEPVSAEWTSKWSDSICFISNSADKISEAYQECLSTDLGAARYRTAPGVAYRLALCAAKEGEVAISLAGPRDFDLAAGHALIRGAGGEVFDERGEAIRYLHHRPHRVGFAFGGAIKQARYASSLEWRPTFDALRSPNTPPFLRPSEVVLIADTAHLNSLQGAWWGWHIGVTLMREGRGLNELSLDKAGAHFAELSPSCRRGDSELVRETRDFCRGQVELEDAPHLRRFLHALTSLGDEPLSTAEGDSLRGSPQGALSDADCARWGAMVGRNRLPPRVISDLVSWREGEMTSWQPDGDRLIESLASSLTLLGERG